jgi:hypothetical protein
MSIGILIKSNQPLNYFMPQHQKPRRADLYQTLTLPSPDSLPTHATAGMLTKPISYLADAQFSKHPLVLLIRRGACFETGGEDQKKIKCRKVFVIGEEGIRKTFLITWILYMK